jgi:HPt (histidine-containing phosphotransfer) domain-containing protein
MDLRLARLAERFRERALSDADELEAIAGGLEASEDKAGDRGIICHLAHRLAGSAGTFGFHQLTESAAQLEDLCRSAATDAELRDLTVETAVQVRRAIEASAPAGSEDGIDANEQRHKSVS